MNDRLLGLHLIVTNPTDRATTIVRAEVRVTYSVSGVVTTVNVPATSTADLDQPLPDVVVVELPVRLEANGGTSGWFLFRVPDGLVGGGGVDRYEVVLKDIHGIEETVQVTIFHEVSL